MRSPLDELEAQIEAIHADMDFVKLASQLRPRLGSILIWDAHGEGTEIAKKFGASGYLVAAGARSRPPQWK
jgi:hypothetical protein